MTHKLSGSDNDTSASANASPVVNKHKAPPTPTIESLFDDILTIDDWVDKHCPFPESSINFETTKRLRLKDLKAKATLLITKAELMEAIEQLEWSKAGYRLPGFVADCDFLINKYTEDIAALTAPTQNPTPLEQEETK